MIIVLDLACGRGFVLLEKHATAVAEKERVAEFANTYLQQSYCLLVAVLPAGRQTLQLDLGDLDFDFL